LPDILSDGLNTLSLVKIESLKILSCILLKNESPVSP
jgi:hypothetical protein